MPRVKQFCEKEVLQKAIDLFWEQGYNATSVQDLVDRLSINRASIYDTFGGKKQLFEKAYKRYKNNNINVLANFLNNQPTIKKGLLKLYELPINASVCDGKTRGCFTVNTTTEMVPDDKDIHAILVENKNEVEVVFYGFLKKGVERGEISKDKDLVKLASFLYTLLNGIMVVAKVNPDKEYLLSIIESGLSVLD